MTLALSTEYPILDIFWTMLVVLGVAVLLWTLVVVFRDLFGRADIGAWRKTLWVVAVLLFPILGSLVYLVSRSEAMGETRLAGHGAGDLRMDEYVHTVSGDGRYRGVRDVTRTTAAWSGPGREA